jgi:oligosaccharide reducing-end xylanase
MALVLAHGRWGSDGGRWDYESDAVDVLNALWTQPEEEEGTDDDTTSIFDGEAHLPYDIPESSSADTTRPPNVMPGYYALWAEATGDPRWSEAAARGRQFLRNTAHPTTGLLPLRASFDGSPVSDTMEPETYRTFLNIATDYLWYEPSDWHTEWANRLLRFFVEEGILDYGASYPIAGGACIDCAHSQALVAMNGVAALMSTNQSRTEFLDAVWNMEVSVGSNRYYDGLLQLLALMVLGGRFRVY